MGNSEIAYYFQYMNDSYMVWLNLHHVIQLPHYNCFYSGNYHTTIVFTVLIPLHFQDNLSFSFLLKQYSALYYSMETANKSSMNTKSYFPLESTTIWCRTICLRTELGQMPITALVNAHTRFLIYAVLSPKFKEQILISSH